MRNMGRTLRQESGGDKCADAGADSSIVGIAAAPPASTAAASPRPSLSLSWLLSLSRLLSLPLSVSLLLLLLTPLPLLLPLLLLLLLPPPPLLLLLLLRRRRRRRWRRRRRRRSYRRRAMMRRVSRLVALLVDLLAGVGGLDQNLLYFILCYISLVSCLLSLVLLIYIYIYICIERERDIIYRYILSIYRERDIERERYYRCSNILHSLLERAVAGAAPGH